MRLKANRKGRARAASKIFGRLKVFQKSLNAGIKTETDAATQASKASDLPRAGCEALASRWFKAVNRS